MVFEFSAIIFARAAFVLLRPHRHVFNLGYAVSEEESGLNDAALVVFGMFLEIILEFAIDFAAIQVEREHGVDLEEYWDQ